MIIPGKQIGKYVIGNNVGKYPELQHIENLSLGQQLYKFEGYLVRTNESHLLNWVCVKSDDKEDYQGCLRLGIKFADVIGKYDLLYDDFEFVFHLEGTEGLIISFNHKPITSSGFLQECITSIMVYDKGMDGHDPSRFEKISKNNLKDYID